MYQRRFTHLGVGAIVLIAQWFSSCMELPRSDRATPAVQYGRGLRWEEQTEWGRLDLKAASVRTSANWLQLAETTSNRLFLRRVEARIERPSEEVLTIAASRGWLKGKRLSLSDVRVSSRRLEAACAQFEVSMAEDKLEARGVRLVLELSQPDRRASTGSR